MNVIVFDELTTIGNASGVKIEPRKPIIGGNSTSLMVTATSKCSRSLLRTLLGTHWIVNRNRYVELYLKSNSFRKKKKYAKALDFNNCKLLIYGY
jgi:hypothetical protein